MQPNKKLTLSLRDRMIGGVCGGLAEYFGIDATLVRAAYVLLTLTTIFSGTLLYLILWIVVPNNTRLLEKK